jgi:hypothetical protein
VRLLSSRLALLGALASALAGCPQPIDATTPATIAISPGVAERLALMDRYRLHDEERKHMMRRPQVWVEEVEEADADADADTSDAAPEREPSHQP